MDYQAYITKINLNQKEDYSKLQDILELTKLLVNANNENFLHWSDQGIVLANKLELEVEAKQFEKNKAQYYNSTEEYQKAYDILKSTKSFFESTGLEKDFFICEGILGNTYYGLELYDEAIQCFQNLADYSLKEKQYKGANLGRINIGAIYSQIKQYKKSIEILNTAREEYFEHETEINDKTFIAHIYTDLGTNYKEFQQYDLSIENHLKALEIFIQLKAFKFQILANIAIGELFMAKNQYKEALEYLKTAESIYNKNPFPEYAKTLFEDLYKANSLNMSNGWKSSYKYLQKLYELDSDKSEVIKSISLDNPINPKYIDKFIFVQTLYNTVLKINTRDIIKVYQLGQIVYIELTDGEKIKLNDSFKSVSRHLNAIDADFIFIRDKVLMVNFYYFKEHNTKEKYIVLEYNSNTQYYYTEKSDKTDAATTISVRMYEEIKKKIKEKLK